MGSEVFDLEIGAGRSHSVKNTRRDGVMDGIMQLGV